MGHAYTLSDLQPREHVFEESCLDDPLLSKKVTNNKSRHVQEGYCHLETDESDYLLVLAGPESVTRFLQGMLALLN